MALSPGEFEAVYRREVGRCTATLVRVLGDVELAEDAVADAFAVAAERWAAEGLPPNPGGWVTTTARNRAIDHLRRESTRRGREREATTMIEGAADAPELAAGAPLDVVSDDQLRLMFLCCHPALGVDAQVALTLRLLGGLTTAEIARAFLVPEPTMGQRLSRAKRKIRDANMAYRLPPPADLPGRLQPVLAVVYLIFTEGHTATAGDELQRGALTAEAIRLARTLAELLPDEPEAAGLLALVLLTHARAAGRVDAHGALVRLSDQDRSCWDRALIDEGHAIVRACVRGDEPGPYQLQAAIAAVHADAVTADETDWPQIVQLYDHLLWFAPTPVVALNRAIAVMEAAGAAAGLAALDRVDLPGYHLAHAARAEALRRLGRRDEATGELRLAISLATNAGEIRHLERELATLGSDTPPDPPHTDQEARR